MHICSMAKHCLGYDTAVICRPIVRCRKHRYRGPHWTSPALANGIIVAVTGAATEGSTGAVGNGSGDSATDTGAGADSQPQAGGQSAAVQAQPLAGCEGSFARGERGPQLTSSRRLLVGLEVRRLWCTDPHG